ncbi:MAG: PEP-CTERM sorting domain-containing protein [Planctomycetota bacterium]
MNTATAAQTIEFDVGPTGSLSSYEEDGFTFEQISGTTLFFVVSDASDGNPRPLLETNAFQFAATSGETFGLVSLDLAAGNSFDTWQVEGFFAAGGSITQNVSPTIDDLWSTAMFSGFEGLQRVEVTPLVGGLNEGLRWDNIVVPEPTSAALVLLGAGAFGVFRRRRPAR